MRGLRSIGLVALACACGPRVATEADDGASRGGSGSADAAGSTTADPDAQCSGVAQGQVCVPWTGADSRSISAP